MRGCAYFNPRSSCEERLDPYQVIEDAFEFQSTLLMRGATTTHSLCQSLHIFQSTLLMRGATRYSTVGVCLVSLFQSTLLMRGATRFAFCHATHLTYFNPRSSCEERQGDEYIAEGTLISIHAPHARSDVSAQTAGEELANFNPRSSCEERPQEL